MLTIHLCDNKKTWDSYILTQGGHPLQLWGWGEVKTYSNWKATRLFIKEEEEIISAAQLLIRRVPGGKSIAYIPRGPVNTQLSYQYLDDIAQYVRDTYDAIVLKIEPHCEDLKIPAGWVKSRDTILIPHTILLDLSRSENDLLSDMTKKTRQYIRKSSKENIEICKVVNKNGINECINIYRTTAQRAGFAIHKKQYYHHIFNFFDKNSSLYAVYFDKKIIAFLWLVSSESVAFELYGGVNENGQNLRVNYALKWYAIKDMKSHGIKQYDLNGLLNDGISNFKRGFSSHEDFLAGTYDRSLSPLYYLWKICLPTIKKMYRLFKR